MIYTFWAPLHLLCDFMPSCHPRSRLLPEHQKRVVKPAAVEPTAEKALTDDNTGSVSEVMDNTGDPWEEGRVEDELSPEEIQMV